MYDILLLAMDTKNGFMEENINSLESRIQSMQLIEELNQNKIQELNKKLEAEVREKNLLIQKGNSLAADIKTARHLAIELQTTIEELTKDIKECQRERIKGDEINERRIQYLNNTIEEKNEH